MDVKRLEVVGGLLFALALVGGAGCGGGNDGTGLGTTPHDAGQDTGTLTDAGGDADVEDASTDVDDVEDAGIDVGQEPPDDLGNLPDAGFPVEDSGTPPPPPETDSGTAGGVCPAACAVSSDCNPCWSTGEPHMSNNYCCVSGLCIFRTGTCDVTPTTDAGTGTGTGTDGGLGGLDASPGGGLDAGGGGGGGGGGLDAGGGLG